MYIPHLRWVLDVFHQRLHLRHARLNLGQAELVSFSQNLEQGREPGPELWVVQQALEFSLPLRCERRGPMVGPDLSQDCQINSQPLRRQIQLCQCRDQVGRNRERLSWFEGLPPAVLVGEQGLNVALLKVKHFKVAYQAFVLGL